MESSMRNRVGRVAGRMGYVLLFMQWTWAGVLVLPWLLQLDIVKKLMAPNGSQTVDPVSFDIVLPSPVLIGIATLSVVGAIGVTIWAITHVPAEMTRTASKTTRGAASRSARALTHHKPVGKTKLFQLTERLVFTIKIVAVVLAIIITWLAPPTAGLDSAIALFVAGFLALVTIAFFGIQRIATTSDQSAL